MKKRLFYIFKLICIISLFYSHQVVAKLEYPCVRVQNEIIQKYNPELDKPFKQEGLNFMLKGYVTDDFRKFLLITRNTIYWITAYKKEIKTTIIKNCEVVVDEEYETVLRCKSEGTYIDEYKFSKFTSDEENPYHINISLYKDTDKQYHAGRQGNSQYMHISEPYCHLYQKLNEDEISNIKTKPTCFDVLNETIEVHHPQLTQPFKQKDLNYVIQNLTAKPEEYLYTVVTRDSICNTLRTGDISSSCWDNCQVLVDTEIKTVLRCPAHNNYIFFIYEKDGKALSHYWYSSNDMAYAPNHSTSYMPYGASFDCPLFEE